MMAARRGASVPAGGGRGGLADDVGQAYRVGHTSASAGHRLSPVEAEAAALVAGDHRRSGVMRARSKDAASEPSRSGSISSATLSEDAGTSIVSSPASSISTAPSAAPVGTLMPPGTVGGDGSAAGTAGASGSAAGPASLVVALPLQQYREFMKSVARKAREHEILRQAVLQERTERGTLRAQLAASTAALKSKEGDLTSYVEEVERLSFQMQALTRKVASLQRQLEDARASAAGAPAKSVIGSLLQSTTWESNEIDKLRARIPLLTAELEEKITENEGLHISMWEVKQQGEKALEAALATGAAASDEAKSLKTLLRAKEASAAAMGAKQEATAAALRVAQQKLVEVTAEATATQGTLRGLLARMEHAYQRLCGRLEGALPYRSQRDDALAAEYGVWDLTAATSAPPPALAALLRGGGPDASGSGSGGLFGAGASGVPTPRGIAALADCVGAVCSALAGCREALASRKDSLLQVPVSSTLTSADDDHGTGNGAGTTPSTASSPLLPFLCTQLEGDDAVTAAILTAEAEASSMQVALARFSAALQALQALETATGSGVGATHAAAAAALASGLAGGDGAHTASHAGHAHGNYIGYRPTVFLTSNGHDSSGVAWSPYGSGASGRSRARRLWLRVVVAYGAFVLAAAVARTCEALATLSDRMCERHAQQATLLDQHASSLERKAAVAGAAAAGGGAASDSSAAVVVGAGDRDEAAALAAGVAAAAVVVAVTSPAASVVAAGNSLSQHLVAELQQTAEQGALIAAVSSALQRLQLLCKGHAAAWRAAAATATTFVAPAAATEDDGSASPIADSSPVDAAAFSNLLRQMAALLQQRSEARAAELAAAAAVSGATVVDESTADAPPLDVYADAVDASVDASGVRPTSVSSATAASGALDGLMSRLTSALDDASAHEDGISAARAAGTDAAVAGSSAADGGQQAPTSARSRSARRSHRKRRNHGHHRRHHSSSSPSRRRQRSFDSRDGRRRSSSVASSVAYSYASGDDDHDDSYDEDYSDSTYSPSNDSVSFSEGSYDDDDDDGSDSDLHDSGGRRYGSGGRRGWGRWRRASSAASGSDRDDDDDGRSRSYSAASGASGPGHDRRRRRHRSDRARGKQAAGVAAVAAVLPAAPPTLAECEAAIAAFFVPAPAALLAAMLDAPAAGSPSAEASATCLQTLVPGILVGFGVVPVDAVGADAEQPASAEGGALAAASAAAPLLSLHRLEVLAHALHKATSAQWLVASSATTPSAMLQALAHVRRAAASFSRYCSLSSRAMTALVALNVDVPFWIVARHQQRCLQMQMLASVSAADSAERSGSSADGDRLDAALAAARRASAVVEHYDYDAGQHTDDGFGDAAAAAGSPRPLPVFWLHDARDAEARLQAAWVTTSVSLASAAQAAATVVLAVASSNDAAFDVAAEEPAQADTGGGQGVADSAAEPASSAAAAWVRQLLASPPATPREQTSSSSGFSGPAATVAAAAAMCAPVTPHRKQQPQFPRTPGSAFRGTASPSPFARGLLSPGGAASGADQQQLPPPPACRSEQHAAVAAFMLQCARGAGSAAGGGAAGGHAPPRVPGPVAQTLAKRLQHYQRTAARAEARAAHQEREAFKLSSLIAHHDRLAQDAERRAIASEERATVAEAQTALLHATVTQLQERCAAADFRATSAEDLNKTLTTKLEEAAAALRALQSEHAAVLAQQQADASALQRTTASLQQCETDKARAQKELHRVQTAAAEQAKLQQATTSKLLDEAERQNVALRAELAALQQQVQQQQLAASAKPADATATPAPGAESTVVPVADGAPTIAAVAPASGDRKLSTAGAGNKPKAADFFAGLLANKGGIATPDKTGRGASFASTVTTSTRGNSFSSDTGATSTPASGPASAAAGSTGDGTTSKSSAAGASPHLHGGSFDRSLLPDVPMDALGSAGDAHDVAPPPPAPAVPVAVVAGAPASPVSAAAALPLTDDFDHMEEAAPDAASENGDNVVVFDTGVAVVSTPTKTAKAATADGEEDDDDFGAFHSTPVPAPAAAVDATAAATAPAAAAEEESGGVVSSWWSRAKQAIAVTASTATAAVSAAAGTVTPAATPSSASAAPGAAGSASGDGDDDGSRKDSWDAVAAVSPTGRTHNYLFKQEDVLPDRRPGATAAGASAATATGSQGRGATSGGGGSDHHDEIQELQRTHEELVAVMSESYQHQIRALSEHAAIADNSIRRLEGELREVEAHAVLCAKCAKWSTVGQVRLEAGRCTACQRTLDHFR